MITVTTQTRPKMIVMRFRFLSATPDEPMVLVIPPPNMSLRPPPRPLWSRINRVSSRLVTPSRIRKAIKIPVILGSFFDLWVNKHPRAIIRLGASGTERCRQIPQLASLPHQLKPRQLQGFSGIPPHLMT